MNIYVALLFCFIVGMFIMLGLLFVFNTKENTKLIDFSVALAFSVLITLGCLEILPESFELISSKIQTPYSYILLFGIVLIGIAILKIIDVFIPDHSHEGKHNKNVLKHIALMTATAIIIHNIIEGASLYSAFLVSFKAGMLFSLGIGLHNIALGLLIGSGIYNSNKDKLKTIKFMLIVSLSTFVGSVLMAIFNMYLESNLILGIILSLTLGMIFYITLLELLPLLFTTRTKVGTIVGLVLGALIMILTMLI